MNITDKAALFKDLGLRVISEATVGYPIRAMDFNILCSLRVPLSVSQLYTKQVPSPLFEFG